MIVDRGLNRLIELEMKRLMKYVETNKKSVFPEINCSKQVVAS